MHTHKQQQRNMTPPKSCDSPTCEFKVLWYQSTDDKLKSSQQSGTNLKDNLHGQTNDISQSRPWEGKLETQGNQYQGQESQQCALKRAVS